MARKQAGFTLLELIIVVAIIGILAAIAIPSYQDYVRKSRRTDATVKINQIQQAQEKWRANNPAYSSTWAELGISGTACGSGMKSENGYYCITITAYNAAVCSGDLSVATDKGTSYCIIATAQGAQASDTACTPIKMKIFNGSATRMPTNC